MQTGIEPERLVFAPAHAGIDSPNALLPAADLFIAIHESSHAQSLIAALCAGVPCLATASPMANSVLHAAGVGDCVFESTATCYSKALQLGRNPAEVNALRDRTRLSVAQSPLFDVASRASERAMAWTLMVERSRAGLPPATFDVPQARTSG